MIFEAWRFKPVTQQLLIYRDNFPKQPWQTLVVVNCKKLFDFTALEMWDVSRIRPVRLERKTIKSII